MAHAAPGEVGDTGNGINGSNQGPVARASGSGRHPRCTPSARLHLQRVEQLCGILEIRLSIQLPEQLRPQGLHVLHCRRAHCLLQLCAEIQAERVGGGTCLSNANG